MRTAFSTIVWPIKQFLYACAAFIHPKMSRERGERRDSLSPHYSAAL